MVKQAPKCKIGFPCGKSCISKTKNCYANLSTKDSKVAETFSQFVNRLVGIGNNTQSELNNVTKEEISTNEPFDINQELKDENFIGGGEFGKVYKSNDSNIVIKEGNLGEDEIRIPQKLKSLGFNNAIEIIEHKENRVAMKLVKGKPINELNDTEVNNLAPKIKEAVKKMGELGVSHNDIHNRNILYNEETDSIVIIDFGLAEDEETSFLDTPNTPSNLRRNIIKDGYKTLRDVLKDIPKLNNLIEYFNSQYGQNIKDIEDLLRYMNTNKFEKIMKDEDKFNELFQFIYN